MENNNGNRVKNEEQDRRIATVEGHIATMNHEMGKIQTDMAKVKTDLNWLKKNYWLVAGASVGALIAGLINILLSK